MDLNDEQRELERLCGDAAFSVYGSLTSDEKESLITRWIAGERPIMISKPSVMGWGLNLQHCARVVFVGLSHSFEAYYQALRRTYRFGQKRPVHVHIITSTAEGAVLANLKRKQAEAETLHAALVAHLDDFTQVKAAGRELATYRPHQPLRIPEWLVSEAA